MLSWMSQGSEPSIPHEGIKILFTACVTSSWGWVKATCQVFSTCCHAITLLALLIHVCCFKNRWPRAHISTHPVQLSQRWELSSPRPNTLNITLPSPSPTLWSWKPNAANTPWKQKKSAQNPGLGVTVHNSRGPLLTLSPMISGQFLLFALILMPGFSSNTLC